MLSNNIEFYHRHQCMCICRFYLLLIAYTYLLTIVWYTYWRILPPTHLPCILTVIVPSLSPSIHLNRAIPITRRLHLITTNSKVSTSSGKMNSMLRYSDLDLAFVSSRHSNLQLDPTVSTKHCYFRQLRQNLSVFTTLQSMSTP